MAANHGRISTPHLTLKPVAMLVLSLALCVIATGVCLAGETPRHVVGSADIQARIDQQLDQDGADRLAIQTMLGQPGVRQAAEAAGLNVDRASAAAATLSGAELKDLASQAREVNAGIGGDRTITITATTLIIVLLIVIILM